MKTKTDTQHRMDTIQHYSPNDVAIIGISLRLPKASTIEEFWDLLVNERTGISDFTDQELLQMQVNAEDLLKKSFVKSGSVIDHPELWDNEFFGYNPKVASITDPQQRLLIECSYKALEHAGYNPVNVQDLGVFVTLASNHYADAFSRQANQADQYIAFTSNDSDFAASRISYALNAKGPSMTINTACSSSLVCVHKAVDSLLKGECTVALAGGASILFPQAGYNYDPNLIFSPDGKCRPFDAESAGTVFGNGIGVVVLKKLKDAIADLDHVYAIIKGTAINNDGNVKASYYAPGIEGQSDVIQKALRTAAVNPSTIGYVEAHGTGTRLGDPIEFDALTHAYRQYTTENAFAYLGSVKSNIGHLNNAAGIAGLLKTILSLYHKKIPATLHYKQSNPEIDLIHSPFKINAHTVDWDKPHDFPRRAGVSSFGIGGTNAHVILEEAPVFISPEKPDTLFILPVSSRTPDALETYKQALSGFLQQNIALQLADVAFTLQKSRTDGLARELFFARTVQEFIGQLNDPLYVSNTGEGVSAELKHWLQGNDIEWNKINTGQFVRRVGLPPHPMHYRACMITNLFSSADSARAVDHATAVSGALIQRIETEHGNKKFTSSLSSDETFIQDHNNIFPAAGYIEILWEAIHASGLNCTDICIKKMNWMGILFFNAGQSKELYLDFKEHKDFINVAFHTNDSTSILAQASIYSGPARASDEHGLTSYFAQHRIYKKDIYALFKQKGFVYGSSFQLIKEISFNNTDECEAIIEQQIRWNKKMVSVPQVLDAAFQSSLLLIPGFKEDNQLYVPFELDEIRISGNLDQPLKIRSAKTASQESMHVFNIDILSEATNAILATFRGLVFVASNNALRTSSVKPDYKQQPHAQQASAITAESLDEYLLKVISEELGHDALTIFDIESDLDKLGLDSVILVNIVNRLECDFPKIPKTIFFEFKNLKEIAGHLQTKYPDKSRQLVSGNSLTATGIIDSEHSFLQHTHIMSTFSSSQQPATYHDEVSDKDIAIIGIHGMYPESKDLNEYWNNIKNGKDCITEIPKDRWNQDNFYNPDVNNPKTSYSKWGGFVKDMQYFDPLFFKIPPKEIEVIDPQERLFLESCWLAIENAGYTPKNLCTEDRSVGVYVGVMWAHYQIFSGNDDQRLNADLTNTSSFWSIANRVSYALDFTGPSMAIDTACSSSLSALHIACNSLIAGESKIALVGGVNLNLHPLKYFLLSERRFAAQDGRCRSFGEGGTGYVPGEGVGTVVIKPLKQALADNDHIHGIIKGTSINHGGKSNGFSVPSVKAQAEVIDQAMKRANVTIDDITYIEAHGTGTSLGDPIEINGLRRAYQTDEIKYGRPIPIGSVKSNIGHLESAAGVAALHKVLLQFKHKKLVPSIHSDVLNPFIEFSETPFKVQKVYEDWKYPNGVAKHTVGISSFGAGGSNAHVIVSEYLKPKSINPTSDKDVLFILSAREQETLQKYARDMKSYLQEEDVSDLEALTYTLQSGRVEFEHRLAIAANSKASLIKQLDAFLTDQPDQYFYEKATKKKSDFSINIIDDAIRRTDYAMLAKLWVEGAFINWMPLYVNSTPNKIPLPGYPFNKRRFWFKEAVENKHSKPMHAGIANMQNGTAQNGALHKHAEDAATATIKTTAAGPQVTYLTSSLGKYPLKNIDKQNRTAKAVLFFATEAEVAAVRKYYNTPVTLVNEPIETLSLNTFAADFEGHEELDLIFSAAEILTDYIQPDAFLEGMFKLIKSTAIDLRKFKLNFFVAGLNLKPQQLPAFRSAGGLFKVASKEIPKNRYRVIEFKTAVQPDQYAEILICELNDQAKHTVETVYQHLERYEYEVSVKKQVPAQKTVSITGGGIYLITGGLGAIGVTIADYLIQKGAAKVIMLGRKKLVELPHESHELLRQYANNMQYVSGDITADIRSILDYVDNTYGKLTGIIHAAGIVRDKMIAMKPADVFHSVIDPKINGIHNIDKAIEGKVLDFVVYCSSVSALEGQMGQSDYAAANKYMDEYAAMRNAQQNNTQYISINWPYWEEGGMRLPEPILQIMHKNGIWGITNEEGRNAFDQALRANTSSIIVFKSEHKGANVFFTDTHLNINGENNAASAASASAPAHTDKQAVVPAAAENQADLILPVLKNKIIQIFCDLLGLQESEVNTRSDLEEYGIDSVVIMKISTEMEKMLEGFSVSLFFECRTIDSIIAKIKEELREGNLVFTGQLPEGVISKNNNNYSTQVPLSYSAETANSGTQQDVLQPVHTILKETLCGLLGIEEADLHDAADIQEYGVDSVMIMKVTTELEKVLNDFSVAVFFECKSINEIMQKIKDELAAGNLSLNQKNIVPAQSGTGAAKAPTSAESYFECKSVFEQTDSTEVLVNLKAGAYQIAHHVIQDKVTLPGAAYIDLLNKIYEMLFKQQASTLTNVFWVMPLFFEGADIEVKLVFKNLKDKKSFVISSSGGIHAKGEIGVTSISNELSFGPVSDLLPQFSNVLGKVEAYNWFESHRFIYKSEYQVINQLFTNQSDVLGKLDSRHQALTPMILDGAFQSIVGLSIHGQEDESNLWLPFFIEKITLYDQFLPSAVYAYITREVQANTSDIQKFTIYLIDDSGKVYVHIKNFTLKAFSKKAIKEEPHVRTILNNPEPAPNRTQQAETVTNNKQPARVPEPIAIIAMACKIPGADSPDEFWDILINEKDLITEIPADRWDYKSIYDPQKGVLNKIYSKWGGFVKDVDGFDADYFKVAESDAICMDPQQRIMLELTQHLLDGAGYSRKDIANKNVGIIIGAAAGMWNEVIGETAPDQKKNVVVNTIQNMIAARLADFYDLKGTAYTMDTACSSSLVAVHEACQKIRNGDCDMMITGGITLLLSDNAHKGFCNAQVLSEYGRCAVFDQKADGIVLGEGAGLVMLKSYRQAMLDGDQILGVIKGSAVNNDGKTMGLTTPSLSMQENVIERSYASADIDPSTITYLEAHGTGTLLGDPIEVKAATRFFGKYSNQKQFCGIGSVKSNVGHLLHASGVTGLIKLILSLKHEYLPATLHCDSPHSRFEFEKSSFYPAIKPTVWKSSPGNPRRAAISSFGFGGTNCHLILEETNPQYKPLRAPLPLTVFNRKKYWPGKEILVIQNEDIKNSKHHAAKHTHSTVTCQSLNDIMFQLQQGNITLDEALILEKELI
jgi:acyl transferase domain-containing protein/acyl carrier protein/NADP-dependent 3-hydroxy acid dehydrogenase YdfG